MKHQLDFEKPILELQNKLDELRKHPEAHALMVNFEEEIALIEKKLAETRRQVFSHLTPWQRVQLARHPRRPFTLDYIRLAFSEFQELHGDRRYAEDRAVVGGFAKLDGLRVMVIGTQRPGHQGKHPPQFRLGASGRVSQGAAVDADGGQIRAAHRDAD